MYDTIQEAEKILQVAEIEENDQKANLLIKSVICIIEYNLIKDSCNFFYFYLIGYAWYFLREDTPERIEKVKVNLKSSIELNNNYVWSKLYLGHLYFDITNYQGALKEFKNIDFYALKQNWRILKVKELILCCEIYLNDKLLGRLNDDLIELIKLYKNIDEIDRPVPLELKECIDKMNFKINDETYQQLVLWTNSE